MLTAKEANGPLASPHPSSAQPARPPEALFARMDRSVLQNARFQPAPDQTDQARITDSMVDKPENPVVTETPEEVLQIRLQHPAYHATGDDLVEGRQGMMGAELRPAAE